VSEAGSPYAPHEIRAEAPDFLFYCIRGAVDLPQLRGLTEVERTAWEGHARVFVLVDAREMSLSPGLVRAAPELYRDSPARIVAVFGASFPTRTLVNSVYRALAMLGQDFMVRFFPDEASARAWITARRERRDRKSRPGGSRPGRPEP
jgi:hypothetical protein